jgi:hypothetical protein
MVIIMVNMDDITVGHKKKYLAGQQKIMMKYIDIKKGDVIANGDPFSLIPKDKLIDFQDEIQDFEYKFICELYNKKYTDKTSLRELADILKQFREDFELPEFDENGKKIEGTSFGLVIAKFRL